MARRPVPLVLFTFLCLQLLSVQGQNAAHWCATGIKQPHFAHDEGHPPSIDIILAQSPLFANSPTFGRKLGLLNLFHTALVLTQQVPGTSVVRNWTVEFDPTTNVLGAVLPKAITNTGMVWDNDARFCVTDGVLWGEGHWSKSYKVVMRVSAAQARRVFKEFVLPLNTTAHNNKPTYQLWKVESNDKPEKTLIKDITCGDGALWILHWLATAAGAQAHADFEFRSTTITFHADRVEKVNIHNATEWAGVVQQFQDMVTLAGKGTSIPERLDEAWKAFAPVKYVYDSNSGTYFHVIGNRFPFFQVGYELIPLQGPPWSILGSRAVASEEVALLV